MIGKLIAAYERGRRDARSGRRDGARKLPQGSQRMAYATGRRDERERMARERRLEQTELFERE